MNNYESNIAKQVVDLFVSCPNCKRYTNECCDCGRPNIREELSPWSIQCLCCGFTVHQVDFFEGMTAETLIAKSLENRVVEKPLDPHEKRVYYVRVAQREDGEWRRVIE